MATKKNRNHDKSRFAEFKNTKLINYSALQCRRLAMHIRYHIQNKFLEYFIEMKLLQLLSRKREVFMKWHIITLTRAMNLWFHLDHEYVEQP